MIYLLQLVLIILKFAGVLLWPWVIVFIPLWACLALWGAVFVFTLIVLHLESK